MNRTFVFHFERLGRGSGPFDETYVVADGPNVADDLAEAVYRRAKKVLASRWFIVTVNLENMTFSVEAGRFGRGTIEEISND